MNLKICYENYFNEDHCRLELRLSLIKFKSENRDSFLSFNKLEKFGFSSNVLKKGKIDKFNDKGCTKKLGQKLAYNR